MDKIGIKTSEFAVTVGVLLLCALLGIVALIKGHDVAAAVSVAVAVAKALGYDWSRTAVKAAALNLASAEAASVAAERLMIHAGRVAEVDERPNAASMIGAVTTIPDHPPER